MPGLPERDRAIGGIDYHHTAWAASGGARPGEAGAPEISLEQLGGKDANPGGYREHISLVGSYRRTGTPKIGLSLLPRLLLDTHILIRSLREAKKLSRTQHGTIDSAVQRGEPIAISAMTLLEIALLAGGEKSVMKSPLDEFFQDLISNPVFRVLPLTYEVALEVASLSVLRDPADRTIVATARVHRLRLVTSDQRIIESKLVEVVE